jgi:tetratricopeptide (TPR) repeat protein
MEYFERALKKDPKYALAYIGLGRCYQLQGSYYLGPRKTYPQAKQYLDKALDLDDTLALAHVQLGIFYLFEWNWPAARRELERGIDLDPTSPDQVVYGFYLEAMGRPAESLALTQRVQELDPLAAPLRGHLARCYNMMRQYDQAITEAQKAIELDPNFFLAYSQLGLAYSQKRMHEKAIAVLQKGSSVGKGHPRYRGLLGYAYARAGQTSEARKVLEELKGFSGLYGYPFAIARVHAALGEKDQAFEWLRKACDERESSVIWLKVDPTLENLRTDPRFAQVLRDMGLPP